MTFMLPHRRVIVCGVILLAAGACAPIYNAPPVGARLLAVSGAPKPQLERGFEIHQLKCAKCHPFVDPAAHDEVELVEDIMPVMARKANLDRADEQAVLDYLLAARKVR